jgi:hypothetical protein
MSDIETMFLVTVNTDGTFTTYSEMPTEPLEPQRKATTYDIYQTAKQIASDVDAQILADRVTKSVISAFAPQTQNISEQMLGALKERGITPDPVVE